MRLRLWFSLMNSSHCLAAPNIGGYTPKRNHREKDRAIERRLIGTLHLAEKSIPRFKIGHPDYATDRHRLGPLLAFFGRKRSG